MIPFFKSKSVFTGTNLQEFNEMREFLKKKGIKYKYKANNQSGRWTGGGSHRGVHGSVGVQNDRDTIYEILIKAKDAKRLGL